ncbi:hypothetical protein [Vibrio harveyi]|uniref:hypothetical protein n=1 Tax=Vibrio harveyi TaxID=669 RepID=UPI003BB6833A
MIADVLTSIKAYLYDRTSSPLLGAFATSLALWNFKILMLFFSKTPYAVKVWEIDFFYSQPFFSSIEHLSWVTNYWMCLYLMPMVTSLFYIYVFPWFSHRVFEFSYNKQITLNNKKKEMQGSELISAEEKEELLSKIEKLNIENRANVLKLREEITQLESQLDSVIKEREELKAESSELRVQYEQVKHRVTDTPVTEADKPLSDKLDGILSTVHSKYYAGEREQQSDLDNASSESEAPSDSVSAEVAESENFYFSASDIQKIAYLRILQGLYLGGRTRAGFGMTTVEFDDAMSDLVMGGYVNPENLHGDYTITAKGIEFYTKLKRSSRNS